MIDKKKLKKSIVILLLIIAVIGVIILIGKTLARYETTATSDKDVDVAFWIIHDDFKTGQITIKDIYPSDNSFDYTFSISNYKENEDGRITQRAETDLEYELALTITTNLPLGYKIEKNGSNLVTNEEVITDEDGTYYKKISLGKDQMEQGTDVTDMYTIKVTFPKANNSNAEYADLIEYIKLDLNAKQIIE